MSDEIEKRLRLARFELPQPNPEIEDEALRSVLAQLPPTPATPRRSRRRSTHDLIAGAFRARRRQLALLAAAVLPSIALGAVVGVLLWPGPSGAVAGSSYPGPMFVPATGWTTVTTSPSDVEAGWAPLAWATNVPLESNPGPFGVFPFGGEALTDLPADGVVVVAWLEAPEAPNDALFRDVDLPLTVSDADVRTSWEGQPTPNIPEYLILARVKEQWVDVRVYFGTLKPSDDVLADANEELARLQIPDPS